MIITFTADVPKIEGYEYTKECRRAEDGELYSENCSAVRYRATKRGNKSSTMVFILKKTVWRADYEEIYFFIDDGEICEKCEYFLGDDDARFDDGNYYQTYGLATTAHARVKKAYRGEE